MKKKRNIYLALALGLCMVILIGCGVAKESAAISSSESVQYPAVLTEILGTVDIKQAASNLFVTATKGDALQSNAQVRTGDDGYARINLNTGTIVRVSPDSLYTVTSNEQKDGSLYTKLSLELGRVYIVLNGGSLDVSTGQGVASVRGSYMMAMIDPSTGSTVVTCLEGHCGAENPDGNVEFGDGQKVILFAVGADGKYEKIKIGAMSESDFSLWMSDVPEAYDMVQVIAKEVGIGLGTLDGGPAANCDQSKALGCGDHPSNNGKDKGNGKGGDGGNGKGGGKP